MLKWLKEVLTIFHEARRESALELYLRSKNVQNISDVEHYTRQFDSNSQYKTKLWW